MQIEIERLDKNDPHRRALWCFEWNEYHRGVCLTSYHEQTRQTNRHKWKGELWTNFDERQYVSKLSRPVSIPADVMDELYVEITRQVIATPVYIGWYNEKHKTERQKDGSQIIQG